MAHTSAGVIEAPRVWILRHTVVPQLATGNPNPQPVQSPPGCCAYREHRAAISLLGRTHDHPAVREKRCVGLSEPDRALPRP